MEDTVPRKLIQGITLVTTYLFVSLLFAAWYQHIYDGDPSLYVVNSTLIVQKQRESIAAKEQVERDFASDTLEAFYDLKLLQFTRYKIATEYDSQRIGGLLRNKSGTCAWGIENRTFGRGTLDCEFQRIRGAINAGELLVTVINDKGKTYSTKVTIRTWSKAGLKKYRTIGELRQFALEGLDKRIHEREAELSEARHPSSTDLGAIPERLGYWDFLYFSLGAMSGMSTSDITPLDTTVRQVVMIQHVVSVILTAFAAFFLIDKIEKRRPK